MAIGTERFSISFSAFAPPYYFDGPGADIMAQAYPTLTAIDVTDNILRLDYLNKTGRVFKSQTIGLPKASGVPSTVSLWIDLRAREVVKSVVDGDEMIIPSAPTSTQSN